MKSLSEQFEPLKKSLIAILSHFTLISILFVFGFLIYSVLTVNQLLSVQEDSAYAESQKSTVMTTFDEATINRINSLRRDEQDVTTQLPNTRINPFVE